MEHQARWEVEISEDFELWWDTLTPDAQEAIDAKVLLLEARGPSLGFPHSVPVKGHKYPLCELVIPHRGEAFRILYVFDPRRAILLLTGADRNLESQWDERIVPKAEKNYLHHLETLKRGS